MFDSDLKTNNWKEILKIERGDVDYSFETFLINMHLSKKDYSERKNYQKNLGSLLQYLIQLKIKIGCIER